MGKDDGDSSARPSPPLATLTPEVLLEHAMKARANGDPATAAKALDKVLHSAPRHPLPLGLRAKVALERGEADALKRFDMALRADPGNADLHLGKAQALEIAGDAGGARIIAEQLAEQAPGFIAALSYLSSLYLAKGESDFTAPFAKAAQKAPQDPNIDAAHCDALAGIGRFEDAARIASSAQDRFPREPHFAFLEASYAGSMGDWDRAEVIFADLPTQSLQRWLAEARHRLRAKDLPAASALLDTAQEAAPHDVAAWALRGLLWRLSDAPEDQIKAQWLHDQAGLVQLQPLQAPDGLLEEASTLLRGLHRQAGMPLSQSLRGGSQTRGTLFHRTEPVLAELHQAILKTLELYRAQLPASDTDHPLLSQRESQWRLAGSWSVRLTEGGDHHTAHIHPAGLLSSALYCAVPNAVAADDQQGVLEIGRPPSDLGLDLEPLATIQPLSGHLALFPSTLYHGTTPFDFDASGEDRLTVAFDVITKSHNM